VRRRPLGSTGLTVTEIGLGLAALGRPGYFNLGHDADLGPDKDVDSMRDRAHAMLDRAYAAGVRYFDAARSYGKAEEFLGSWLTSRSLDPSDVVVGSKWGYRYTADWRPEAEVHEVKDHSAAALSRQLGETRTRLNGWLDLYQIHSAVLETGVLDDKDVLLALVRLRDEGVTIGLSVSGPAQADVVRTALDAEVDGVNPFGCVQATWNLLEPSAGRALADAAAAGWGVIVKEGVANGRLTDRNDDPSFAGARAVLDRVAGRRGVGIDAVALAAVLAQPWTSVVLSGASTPEQLESNLRADDVSLTEGDRAELAELAEGPEDYWSYRAELPWT
jgi:aryl-alcohol dehydrogenase-like predicted oxidoreductase